MVVRNCLIFLSLVASIVAAEAQDKDELVVIGELVFFTCQTCHLVGDKKLVKPGPHLNELFGRKPGSLPGFTYSPAMTEFGKTNVWDEATLTKFLHDPSGVVVGTSMKFPGLKKEVEVQALLAYLATFDKNGMAPE